MGHPKHHGTVKGDPTVTTSFKDMPVVEEAMAKVMKKGMPLQDVATFKFPCTAKYDQPAFTPDDPPGDAPALTIKGVVKIEKSHAQGLPAVNSGKAKLVSGGVTVTGVTPIEDG